DVDHVRERTAEAVEVPVDDVARGALARRGAGRDLGRRERRTAGRAIRRLERRPREQRLDAAALPAVAGRSGRIDGVVAPLAGDVLRPAPEAAVVHEAAADAGAENHPEHHPLDLRPPEVDPDDHGSVYHTQRDPMYGRWWRIACRTPKAA